MTIVRSRARRAALLVATLCAAIGPLTCSPAGTPPASGTAAAGPDAPAAVNRLTPEEEAAGWRLLFDGTTTVGWRGYNQDAFPTEGWHVDDGNLVVQETGTDEAGLGGSIITEEQFDSFELTLEFKLAPVANSGVLYRVVEREGAEIWHDAPEFQVIDDQAYIDMGTIDMRTHLTGDNYDLHAAPERASRPIGEWNQVRILVDGNHVEHWLNGQQTVEYDLLSPEWETLVAKSKFAGYPGYGRAPRGHIGLQDHGHEVRYRNIKIRPRPVGGTPLFNGRDLEGWTVHGTERWYVDQGDLVCESGPDAEYGYLATDRPYKDFELSLEFKQEADGNSGVFFRSSLDGTRISGWQAEVAPPGLYTGGIYESYGRGWLIQPDPEKDAALRMGNWNRMIVRVDGSRVTTWLNGIEMVDLIDEQIGEADGVIALQIHDGGGIKVRWRNLMVTDLE
jgi:hypothetical protein